MRIRKVYNAVNGIFERKVARYKNPKIVHEKRFAVVRRPRVMVSECFINCLGFALYDPEVKVMGFAHVYAEAKDTTVKKIADGMIGEMEGLGASPIDMYAKLCGETQDYKAKRKRSEAVRHILKRKGIPIRARYLGKGTPQDVIAHSVTGEIEIYNSQLKEIIFI